MLILKKAKTLCKSLHGAIYANETILNEIKEIVGEANFRMVTKEIS